MSNKLSKVMALAAITAAVGAWTSQAHATLTYFLADASDPLKTAFTPTADGSVALGLYVKTDALTSSSFVIGGGSFVVTNLTTGSLATGSFAAPVLETSVNAPGSQIGASYTSSAFTGFTNWGSVNETTKDGYFYANSTSAANIGTTIPVGGSLKLGTVNFSFTGLEVGNAISLNFVPRERTGTNDQIWFEDSVAKNDTTATANAGTDITITKANSGPHIFSTDEVLTHTSGERQTAAVTKVYEAGFSFTTGTLDVTNNDVVFRYAAGDNGATIASLQNLFYASFNDPLVKPYITSSELGENKTLSFVDAGGSTDPITINGIDFTDSMLVLCKYTYVGDITLDGRVDIDDYNIVVLNFGISGGFNEGDITGDGLVDIDDYNTVVSNFGLGTGGLNGVQLHAPAPVPEPASLGLLALGAVALLRSRRRA